MFKGQFNKEKNIIYIYCPDINVYNVGADLMYDWAEYIHKNTDYKVAILHAKDTFGSLNWKIKPECDIKYLSQEIHFDEEDIMLFSLENLALLFAIKDLNIRKIPVVIDNYHFVASAIFTTKHSAAVKIDELGVEKVLYLEHGSIMGNQNMEKMIQTFFMFPKENIVRQPFNYINLDVYNDIMESETFPDVKELENGKFTIEDKVVVKPKDIDVLFKLGNVLSNALLGYLVNKNDSKWIIDFIDYSMTEQIRADKMKRAKVYIDVDTKSFDVDRATLCGCHIQSDVAKIMMESDVDKIIERIGCLLQTEYSKDELKKYAKKFKKINLKPLEEMINDETREQKKTD